MSGAPRTLRLELLRFIATGLLAVGTDFSSYWLLSDVLAPNIAKGFSFILGSIVAFVMNNLWTFDSSVRLNNTVIPFACLYGMTFIANILVNHLVLNLGSEMKLLAFLLATLTSTALNFLGMKFWVFRQNPYS